ncbi:MAG: hypothetical protein IKV96_04185 [Firmicutes bacterium]|nr:hypothetical protein [Bacillota bacterium]
MAEILRPDLSEFDLNTYQDRKAAFEKIFSVRAAEGETPVGDIQMLQPIFVDYTEEEVLTLKFNIFDWQVSNIGYIQAGFLVAMVDCAYGPMSDVCSDLKSAGTIDFNTYFLRPITKEDEEVTVVVKLTTNTRRIMHFKAELLNSKGKTALEMNINVMKR